MINREGGGGLTFRFCVGVQIAHGVPPSPPTRENPGALGDAGSSIQFLQYMLTNQYAWYFNFLLKFGLAYLQTFQLPYLSYLSRNVGKSWIISTMSSAALASLQVDLCTINWACDNHSSVVCLGLFQLVILILAWHSLYQVLIAC